MMKLIHSLLVRTALSAILPLSVVFAAAEPVKIVAFGDSTTVLRSSVRQVYSQRLPDLLKAQGIVADVVNAGVPGSHTGSGEDHGGDGNRHAKDRFEKQVREQKPQIVILQFGINDCWVDKAWKANPLLSLLRSG